MPQVAYDPVANSQASRPRPGSQPRTGVSAPQSPFSDLVDSASDAPQPTATQADKAAAKPETDAQTAPAKPAVAAKVVTGFTGPVKKQNTNAKTAAENAPSTDVAKPAPATEDDSAKVIAEAATVLDAAINADSKALQAAASSQGAPAPIHVDPAPTQATPTPTGAPPPASPLTAEQLLALAAQVAAGGKAQAGKTDGKDGAKDATAKDGTSETKTGNDGDAKTDTTADTTTVKSDAAPNLAPVPPAPAETGKSATASLVAAIVVDIPADTNAAPASVDQFGPAPTISQIPTFAAPKNETAADDKSGAANPGKPADQQTTAQPVEKAPPAPAPVAATTTPDAAYRGENADGKAAAKTVEAKFDKALETVSHADKATDLLQPATTPQVPKTADALQNVANVAASAPAQHTAAASTPALAQNPAQAAAVPLAGLAVEIVSKARDGKNSFDIRLDPPELGRIHVRLDVDSNGDVSTRMIADRPDTLDLLRRDAPTLERALQDAGLKTAGNGLQFSLRDQGFARPDQNVQAQSAIPAIVADEATPITDAIPAGYRRVFGATGGIDIRV